MLSKKMSTAINKQINAEFYSSYLYLAMSSYCSGLDLNGFANWFRIQAMEEMTHAMKFYDYILEQGGQAVVPAIEQPPQEFQSPQATPVVFWATPVFHAGSKMISSSTPGFW